MAKDSLADCEQLLALDLNTEFPGIQPISGVHTPTMGEVRLIYAVIGGGIIPDDIVKFCQDLTKDYSVLTGIMKSWNSDSETTRANPQISTTVARTLTTAFGLYFHSYQETCQMYKISLARSVRILGLAKMTK